MNLYILQLKFYFVILKILRITPISIFNLYSLSKILYDIGILKLIQHILFYWTFHSFCKNFNYLCKYVHMYVCICLHKLYFLNTFRPIAELRRRDRGQVLSDLTYRASPTINIPHEKAKVLHLLQSINLCWHINISQSP